MPGVDDAISKYEIKYHLEINAYKTMPVFIINLDQGGIDLAHFSYIKKLFRNLKIIFVFTKFQNLILNTNLILAERETPTDDVD